MNTKNKLSHYGKLSHYNTIYFFIIMFDLIINLQGLFKYCFGKSNKDYDITNIIKTINNIKDKNQKIQVILQKLVNSKHTLGIIWKVETDGDHRIFSFFGALDENKITTYFMKNIPVYIKGKLSYYIMVFDETKKKMEINNELVELLVG